MVGFEAEDKLRAFDRDSGDLVVIVETPQGSRNKFKLDLQVGQFRLNKVLPAGMAFPFDFGFIPSTRGEDGDPLDVLLLHDEPTFVGCLASARLIGVIEAEQTEDGKTMRNDRLVAVASESREHKGIDDLSQLSPNLLTQIEGFFTSYNAVSGKQFKVLDRKGSRDARKLVEDGMQHFKKLMAREKKHGSKKNAGRK